MAVIVQQPTTQAPDMSAARAFWEGKMQEHPNLAGSLAIGSEIAGFFFNGHFIVALARWIIRVSGYVAESALLFAVLWISGTSVAPKLVELVMSEQTMQYFVSVALIALALIPEVILANAIVNALSHVHSATQKKTVVAWIWAVLFVIPTILFLVLTSITLNTLVANNGNFVQASTSLVGMRCFTGFLYGLLEMVFVGVGKRMIGQSVSAQPAAAPVPQPAIQIDYQEVAQHLQPLITNQVSQLSTQWNAEVDSLRTQLADLASLMLTQSAAPAGAPIVDTDVLQTVNTEPVARKPRTSTKKTPVSGRQNARTLAEKVLKRHPEYSAAELAQKAQISKSYAAKILAEMKEN